MSRSSYEERAHFSWLGRPSIGKCSREDRSFAHVESSAVLLFGCGVDTESRECFNMRPRSEVETNCHDLERT